jgi:hypothetical protein
VDKEEKMTTIYDRDCKMSIHDMGLVRAPGQTLSEFLLGLPKQLVVKDLQRVAERIAYCKLANRPVIAAIGGHVIKTGCSPYLIDWIDKGILTGIAMNGAAAIHDYEIAVAGKTSEDVEAGLEAGTFGMAKETAEAFGRACHQNMADGVSTLGRCLGRYAAEHPHADKSVLARAYCKNISCTVHMAIGTDTIHLHPCDGANLGAALVRDFRHLCNLVFDMSEAGPSVWLNIGSAVILPEVFLKCVAFVMGAGRALRGTLAVNMDFEKRYRTTKNVLERPVEEGVELIGHHEIMIPLLHATTALALEEAKDGQRNI